MHGVIINPVGRDAVRNTAKTGEKPAIIIMATTINAKVQNIRVYSNGDSIRYRVSFDTEFDAFVKTNDEYVEGQVNYIDFVPRHLIAIVLNAVPGTDLLYTAAKERSLRNDSENGFGAAQLSVILRDAKMVLEREKFEAGSEYTDADGVICTHEHDGYNTEISSITVTDRVQAKLDQLMDKILGL